MSTLKRTLVGGAVVVVIMLTLAAVVIASLSARTTASDVVPVALVNLDEPVTVGEGDDEQTIAAGRQLAAEITQGSDSMLAWTLVDGDIEGISLDEYAAIVTIPESFSAAVSGLREGTPEETSIILETSVPASPMAARIADEVTTASAQVFNDDFTVAYLESVFLSYDGISEGIGESAEGAASLADAATDLSEASVSLADGAAQVATGAQSAQGGASSLADGAASAAEGAAGVSGGAASLASSLSTLQSTASSTLAPAADGSASASAGVAAAVATLAATCPPTAGPEYCAHVAAVAAGSADAAHVAAGTATVAAGITDGLVSAAAAGASLADGAASSAAAASSITDAAVSLSQATADLSGSTASLAQGATDLSAGAVPVADGAVSLADGLVELNDAVPTYGEETAAELAAAVTSPTSVQASMPGGISSTAFAALAFGVAMWVAIALLFQRRPAVPEWALASGGSTLRAVLLGFVPRAGIAVAAAFVLWLGLLVGGATGSGGGQLLVVMLAGAVVLTAVLQAIYTVFPRRAWIVVTGLGVVQIIAASLYAPLATASGPVQSLSETLPLSILMRLARDAVFGLQGAETGAGFTLTMWLVAALGVSVLAARMRSSRRAVYQLG